MPSEANGQALTMIARIVGWLWGNEWILGDSHENQLGRRLWPFISLFQHQPNPFEQFEADAQCEEKNARGNHSFRDGMLWLMANARESTHPKHCARSKRRRAACRLALHAETSTFCALSRCPFAFSGAGLKRDWPRKGIPKKSSYKNWGQNKIGVSRWWLMNEEEDSSSIW